MKTMTVDEYRPLFIQAIKDSKETRWIPLMQRIVMMGIYGEMGKGIPPCALCILSRKFNEDESETSAFLFHHIVCPFYNDQNEVCNCSDGWNAWCDADTREERITAAKQVLVELDAIDVEEWIETLVKRGALIP